jgi:hypothetical protein
VLVNTNTPELAHFLPTLRSKPRSEAKIPTPMPALLGLAVGTHEQRTTNNERTFSFTSNPKSCIIPIKLNSLKHSILNPEHLIMTSINLAESHNLPFLCLRRSYFLLSAIVALHSSRVLYKFAPFMQNKPNLLNAQINVTSVKTKDYGNDPPRTTRKSKPKQTQFQTFCWRCRTEKIMFCNRLNGKCQFNMAKT